ncbi:MAG: hypothetical protein Q9223_003054 [Gallowayella weberi]
MGSRALTGEAVGMSELELDMAVSVLPTEQLTQKAYAGVGAGVIVESVAGKEVVVVAGAGRGCVTEEDSELLTEDSELLTEDSELLTEDKELLTEDSELLAEDSELLVEDSELTEDSELLTEETTEEAELVTEERGSEVIVLLSLLEVLVVDDSVEVGRGRGLVVILESEVVAGSLVVVEGALVSVAVSGAGVVPGTPPAGQQAGLSAGQAATGPFSSVVWREVTVLQWSVSTGAAIARKGPAAKAKATRVRTDILKGVVMSSFFF